MTAQYEFVVSAEEQGARLDVYLAARLEGISRTRAQKLVDANAVLVSDVARPAKYCLQEGERVKVSVPPPVPAAPKAQNIPLQVLHEDDDLLVINKPAGLVVHPGAGTPDGTLVNALLARIGSISSIGGVERPGIVHRLDKDTSGLMLVAKNDFSHGALSAALAERRVTRNYQAIALRAFSENSGSIDVPIGRHATVRTRMAVDGAAARSARTHWRILERFHGLSLVECRLDTGRTHQIRVHLAHIKHPVLGDDNYGGGLIVAQQLVHPNADALRNAIRQISRQMLHAWELKFEHPRTAAPMRFEIEPPEDFTEILNALRVSVGVGDAKA